MDTDLVKSPSQGTVATSGGIILPAVIADAGERASRRFIEFLTATIRNANTRQAYARAIGDFFAWCERHGLALAAIEPVQVAIPFAGWSRAYQAIDQFITVASFIVLFLIQRSQSKGMFSLQVKLNELLAAADRASPELINVEDRTESEVQEIHDRFQEIQQRGPEAQFHLRYPH